MMKNKYNVPPTPVGTAFIASAVPDTPNVKEQTTGRDRIHRVRQTPYWTYTIIISLLIVILTACASSPSTTTNPTSTLASKPSPTLAKPTPTPTLLTDAAIARKIVQHMS